jgi:hypothetical protein
MMPPITAMANGCSISEPGVQVRPWFAASLLLRLTALTQAQYGEQALPQGRITGTVVDADGTPVSRVSVSLLDAALADQMETHHVTTDSDRGFEIKNLELKTYSLMGEKQQDAYPSAQLTFTDGGPALVELTPEMPSASIILKLGSKAGILSSTVTKEPIPAVFEPMRVADKHEVIWASHPRVFGCLSPLRRN